MFVDSHCHLEMEEYDGDRRAVVERAAAEGVGLMITVGTEARYFEKVVAIIEEDSRVYGALGIHPHSASEYSDVVEQTITRYLPHPRIVAYGEIGLDFYRNYAPREAQVGAFERQLALASGFGLPVVIHSRNAKTETLDILGARAGSGTIVVHCYSYDIETARRLLDMGAYLSIPGTVTYSDKGVAEVVRYVPLGRLLSETDSPFLAPVPMRGKRNEPAYVSRVVERMALLKAKTTEEVASALEDNFRSVFLNGGAR